MDRRPAPSPTSVTEQRLLRMGEAALDVLEEGGEKGQLLVHWTGKDSFTLRVVRGDSIITITEK